MSLVCFTIPSIWSSDLHLSLLRLTFASLSSSTHVCISLSILQQHVSLFFSKFKPLITHSLFYVSPSQVSQRRHIFVFHFLSYNSMSLFSFQSSSSPLFLLRLSFASLSSSAPFLNSLSILQTHQISSRRLLIAKISLFHTKAISLFCLLQVPLRFLFLFLFFSSILHYYFLYLSSLTFTLSLFLSLSLSLSLCVFLFFLAFASFLFPFFSSLFSSFLILLFSFLAIFKDFPSFFASLFSRVILNPA
ncbi:unnamed protein product [Acanthosepion pharaonis]|uniref:Uncharacterized protein n=1 Tax=Acanthosepion pharaonis TaxID=158019 RepID=A0A812BY57_ACAPH|nr:unnamed protein product [Sepia pharaonis]